VFECVAWVVGHHKAILITVPLLLPADVSSDEESPLMAPITPIKRSRVPRFTPTPEKFPSLFAASAASSDEEEENPSDAESTDMFGDANWLHEGSDAMQNTQEFGDFCSMRIDEEDEDDCDQPSENPLSPESSQSIGCSPSIIARKKSVTIIDLTQSSLDSEPTAS
jgi:hypothetical protein